MIHIQIINILHPSIFEGMLQGDGIYWCVFPSGTGLSNMEWYMPIVVSRVIVGCGPLYIPAI